MDTFRVSPSDLFYSLFQDEMEYGIDELHWLISIDERETEVTSSETDASGCHSVCDLPHTVKVIFHLKDFFFFK